MAVRNNYVGKQTKYYDKYFDDNFDFGFSKKRVADHLKEILIEGEADKPTTDNLSALVSAIIARFKNEPLPPVVVLPVPMAVPAPLPLQVHVPEEVQVPIIINDTPPGEIPAELE